MLLIRNSKGCPQGPEHCTGAPVPNGIPKSSILGAKSVLPNLTCIVIGLSQTVYYSWLDLAGPVFLHTPSPLPVAPPLLSLFLSAGPALRLSLCPSLSHLSVVVQRAPVHLRSDVRASVGWKVGGWWWSGDLGVDVCSERAA